MADEKIQIAGANFIRILQEEKEKEAFKKSDWVNWLNLRLQQGKLPGRTYGRA